MNDAQVLLPPADPRQHLPLAALREALAALPAPPLDHGVVALIVERHPGEARRAPKVGVFAPGQSLINDRWAQSERAHPEAEVTLMRADVAALVCNGQDLSLPGDNLLVTLDLSAANLPTGSRLQVGEGGSDSPQQVLVEGARVAVIIGDDEVAGRQLSIKPLRGEGKQQLVALADAAAHIKHLED